MASDADLLRVWTHARDVVGLLGPGPVADHLSHAERFVDALPDGTETLIDLGSGAGVPGLALALRRPSVAVTLLDGSVKRCAYLQWAVDDLALNGQVTVVTGRAEELGQRPELRETFDVATARSFAAPAVTAECGSAFVKPGGVVLVSEPPDRPDRWDAEGLAKLSLTHQDSTGIARLTKVAELDGRYPRRNGIPNKRPLF